MNIFYKLFRISKPSISVPMIIFLVIVLVCLAQIFWWIYYQIQQNTVVFQLHQSAVSVQVQKAVSEINQAFEQLIIQHVEVHRKDLAANDQSWVPEVLKNDRALNSFYCTGDTVYYVASDGLVLKLTVQYDELRKRLNQRHPQLTLEQLPRTSSKIYHYGPARTLRLPMIVRPKTEFMDNLIDKTDRKTIMFISEGVFFSLMVLGGVYVMFVMLKKELKLESQQKNFILSITHELKSPLASIKLYLQTLLSKQVPIEKQIRFFNHSLYDVERLERLVENVLEAARLERGEFHFDMKPVRLFEVLNPCVQKIRSFAEDEELELTVKMDEEIYIMGDRHAMLSVFNNLLENAVKYSITPKRISLCLYHDHRDAFFEIEDNGPGIEKKDMRYIFDRFYRAGNEMTRNTKGTGIGLYLVKKIIEAHNGEITVNTTKSGGTGALFKIRIPLLNYHKQDR